MLGRLSTKDCHGKILIHEKIALNGIGKNAIYQNQNTEVASATKFLLPAPQPTSFSKNALHEAKGPAREQTLH